MQKLKPGDLVRLRHAHWHIVDIRPFDACQIVTVAGAGPNGERVERRFISPFDSIERIERPSRVRVVGPRRWRRACRELLASNAPPGAIRTARHARMEVLPHQLEPALAILRGLGSRVLLADDVGLGKTLQAGLIAAELRARRCADRILILTPPGLRDQWAGELADRLGIIASIVDALEIRRRLAALPVGLNPWTTFEIAIASVDYVKRPEVLPAVSSCRWDLVIIDEAHGVTGESDRSRAVSSLASRAAFVLLLTATPHSGDADAFASLCATGRQDRDPLLVFRRSRRDVGLPLSRRVHCLRVRPSAAEARMHGLLDRFARAVRRERGETAALALSVLRKRALSSARSLELSVSRRIATLDARLAGEDASALQCFLPLDDACGELNAADEPPVWSEDVALVDSERERRILIALRDAARTATAAETKIRALRRLLRRVGEPALIFTEYRDTLIHLGDRLDGPVALLHGGLPRHERMAALSRFSGGECPILLATDAAGEGLNLHHACRLVVNLELPWNPVRLEQRIGRVDRIGQRRTVHAIHLIARHTTEPRILERLKCRVARAREAIDAPDPIGGSGDRGGPAQADGCSYPRLEWEAGQEAARLMEARRFAPPFGSSALPGSEGPWLMRARHRITRARLQGRAIFLFRAAYEDGCGHVVESTLAPIALGPLAPAGRSTSWRRIGDVDLRRIEEGLTARLMEAVADWRSRASAGARSFASARLGRERSIGAATAPHVGAAMQRGLFDRRAEAAWQARSASHREAQAEHERRLAAIERAAMLSFGVRLLLIVTP